MNSREIVNEIFKEADISIVEYAKMLGISRAALWDRMKSKKIQDMTVGMMSEMVGALGYRVVVIKNGGRVHAEKAYVVD